MKEKLKTLKDIFFNVIFERRSINGEFLTVDITEQEIKKELRKEAIKWIKNLQSSKTIYPIILGNFPEDMKGEIAKHRWNETNFRYGSEYGMISLLMYFFNITEEDLNEN